MADVDKEFLIKVKADIDAALANLKRLETQVTQLGGAGNKTAQGIEQTNTQTEDMGRTSLVTAGALSTLAGGLAALKLGQVLSDSTQLAARIETLGVVLETVGRNAGYTRGQVDGAVDSMRAMGVSTEAAHEATVRMVQAQLDLNKAAQLAQIAQNAAVIANSSSADALRRLIAGVSSLQPEMLRNMGIVVDLEREYTKFARSANRTTDSLTTAEKQQIALNAVLREGEKITGVYGRAMTDAGAQVDDMRDKAEALQEQIGRLLIAPRSAAISNTSSALEQLTENFRSWNLLLGTSGLETASLEKIDALIAGISNDIARLASTPPAQQNLLDKIFGSARIAQLKLELTEVVKLRDRLVSDPAALGQRLSAFGQIGISRLDDFGPSEAQLEAQAKREEKLRAAQLALRKAAVEASAEITKAGIDRESELLDRSYKDGLTGIADYYARRGEIQRRSIDAEIRKLQDEIALQRQAADELSRQKPGVNRDDQEKERLGVLANLKRLEAELTVLQLRRGQVGQNSAHAQRLAEKALADELTQVQARLLEAQGRTADARTLEISRQYSEMIKRMQVEGDPAGEELVRKLINVEAARAALDQMQAEFDRVIEHMNTAETRINTDRTAGLKSELQARRELNALHEETARQLDLIVPKMQALAGTIGDKEVEHVRTLQEEVRGLGIVVDEVANRAKASLENGLVQALDDAAAGTKSLGGIVDSFADSMIAALRRIAAERSAAIILDSLGSSAFGDFFSKLIGTAVTGSPATVAAAEGGLISGPGTGTSDSIPARLSNGEFVVRAAAVERYGVRFMDAINRMHFPAMPGISSLPAPKLHFADGGLVTAGAGAGRHSAPAVIINVSTPDAASFRRSEAQIGQRAGEAIRRSMARNG